MGWTKHDNTAPLHHKFAVAGDLGGWLWYCCVQYCDRVKSDGFVPREAITQIGFRRLRDLKTTAERCCSAGLLEANSSGWFVHDYLDYQRSKADSERVSDVRKRLGAIGGKTSQEQRRKQTIKQIAPLLAGENSSNDQADQSREDLERTKARAREARFSTPPVENSDPDEVDVVPPEPFDEPHPEPETPNPEPSPPRNGRAISAAANDPSTSLLYTLGLDVLSEHPNLTEPQLAAALHDACEAMHMTDPKATACRDAAARALSVHRLRRTIGPKPEAAP